jgi:hypothetical protein
MGDIEMIKGFLLAWLLCRQKWIFYGEVVVHRIISALAVYRREEGEETDKYTATKAITKHDKTISYAGVIYRSASRYRARGNPSGKVFSIPDLCRKGDRRGKVPCLRC